MIVYGVALGIAATLVIVTAVQLFDFRTEPPRAKRNVNIQVLLSSIGGCGMYMTFIIAKDDSQLWRLILFFSSFQSTFCVSCGIYVTYCVSVANYQITRGGMLQPRSMHTVFLSILGVFLLCQVAGVVLVLVTNQAVFNSIRITGLAIVSITLTPYLIMNIIKLRRHVEKSRMALSQSLRISSEKPKGVPVRSVIGGTMTRPSFARTPVLMRGNSQRRLSSMSSGQNLSRDKNSSKTKTYLKRDVSNDIIVPPIVKRAATDDKKAALCNSPPPGLAENRRGPGASSRRPMSEAHPKEMKSRFKAAAPRDKGSSPDDKIPEPPDSKPAGPGIIPPLVKKSSSKTVLRAGSSSAKLPPCKPSASSVISNNSRPTLPSMATISNLKLTGTNMRSIAMTGGSSVTLPTNTTDKTSKLTKSQQRTSSRLCKLMMLFSIIGTVMILATIYNTIIEGMKSPHETYSDSLSTEYAPVFLLIYPLVNCTFTFYAWQSTRMCIIDQCC
mmetsp:Transcript_10478/g.20794  ORF Transcript_10478/g.20794 Transcript_10478/m.20794 type:complete len:498 (+) Transcript_10478:279-1772(+)